jgi:DNA repair exonuclease SbcCD nuclease subunit
MNTYKLCEEGFKSKDLLEYAPLVISGHFHLREERVYEKGKILYVGCPFELDFGDVQSTKGYYILDLDNLKYTFYENTISPKHQKLVLSNLIKIDDFNEHAPKLLSNNIVRLIVDKKIDTKDLESLSLKLNGYYPLSMEFDQTYNFSLFDDTSIDGVDLSGIDMHSAITDFVNMLDIQNKKDVIEYTISLYNSCK